MKTILFFASVLSLAVVTGCDTKSEKSPVEETPINPSLKVNEASTTTLPATTEAAVTTTPATTTTTSQAVTKDATSTPININKMPSQATTTTNTAGLNPAHGQPGHRCDISVGAPLNSSPVNTTTTTNSAPVNLQPSISTTPPKISAPSTVSTIAPGMNPAHGQPEHRCDIAVGAPLNSSPAIPAQTTPKKENQ